MPRPGPAVAAPQVERVVAERDGGGKCGGAAYLVKWEGLPYAECTWEEEQDVSAVRKDTRGAALARVWLVKQRG
jgi:chromodomain-helicase-DNA-binding protein 1